MIGAAAVAVFVAEIRAMHSAEEEPESRSGENDLQTSTEALTPRGRGFRWPTARQKGSSVGCAEVIDGKWGRVNRNQLLDEQISRSLLPGIRVLPECCFGKVFEVVVCLLACFV